ncbi:M48 family metallopeptidase [Chloroflexota bacterium]
MPHINELSKPALNQAKQKKAKEYAKIKRRLSFGELSLAGILLLVLVFSGLSQRLAALFALPIVPAAATYFVILMVVYAVISAPLSYYSGFVLPHRYGLSIQKFTGWLGDQIKARGLSLLLSTLVLAAIYWFITLSPSTWWLLSWGLVVLLSLILTHLFPIIIVPLLFKIKPLGDAEIDQRLEQLVQKAQTRIRGVYTIELGSKLTSANAALMGWGNTKRIVLSDTLLQQYSPPEIETVTAHELGHYLHNDTLRLFATMSAIWLVVFYITGIALKAGVLLPGFSSISDIATLPLLILIFAALHLLTSPLIRAYSRHLEAAADEYALRLTDNPQSFIDAMTKLTDQNLSEAQPSRWVELLMDDHPSYNQRIEHAFNYSIHRLEQQEV